MVKTERILAYSTGEFDSHSEAMRDAIYHLNRSLDDFNLQQSNIVSISHTVTCAKLLLRPTKYCCTIVALLDTAIM
ncbi:MAG: hypothetical protein KDB27_15700 [Planctomycetales bacterium]|nr:hypothetical protein [Planctomycetales bacterium]